MDVEKSSFLKDGIDQITGVRIGEKKCRSSQTYSKNLGSEDDIWRATDYTRMNRTRRLIHLYSQEDWGCLRYTPAEEPRNLDPTVVNSFGHADPHRRFASDILS